MTFVSGTSDQPDNGLGDGNTTNDLVVKPGSVCARAERDGKVLYGRTYAITATATDAASNQGQLTFDITVPHDFSPSCVTGGEPTDASDPRCIPPPPSVPHDSDLPADTAASELAPVHAGCASSDPDSVVFSLALVAGLTLRRRRRR